MSAILRPPHLANNELPVSLNERLRTKQSYAIAKDVYGEDYGISSPNEDKPALGRISPLSEQISVGTKSNSQRYLNSTNLVDDRVFDFSVFISVVPHIPQEQANYSAQITDANDHEEIFNILDIAGCKKIAMRLRYLHEITQDDDPDDPAMQFTSLRELARFFTNEGSLSLPNPEIGISPNGLLQAEWHLNRASALMKFLPDGNVRFAATLGRRDGQRPLQGEDTKEVALAKVQPYIVQ